MMVNTADIEFEVGQKQVEVLLEKAAKRCKDMASAENKLEEAEKSYNGKKMRNIGVLKDDQLSLNYTDCDYTASFTFKINQYSMDGTWCDSLGQKGVSKWIKSCKLS